MNIKAGKTPKLKDIFQFVKKSPEKNNIFYDSNLEGEVPKRNL